MEQKLLPSLCCVPFSGFQGMDDTRNRLVLGIDSLWDWAVSRI